MLIIAGLGNPGEKYQKTRHNLGFIIIDEFRKKNNFPRFRLTKKFNSLVSEKLLNNKKVVLAKPQTFMNNSGNAIKSLIKNRKLEIKNLFIIHDDIDLPLGKIKITKNRGAGGHNGVQSVIDALNTLTKLSNRSTEHPPRILAKSFIRFRIGIQPKTGKPRNIEKFVLENFTKNEEKEIKKIAKKTCEAIEIAIKESAEKAMSRYNNLWITK